MYMNEQLKKLNELINDADAIVIGAGAGLSASAGFEYGGRTFLKHFKYMNDKYGYTDMYSAGFHNFKSSEEKWGYWSKFIYLNRYQGVKKLYKDLFELIKDKNYFVITTNVDHQFQFAGFDKKRLFYMQGDYGLLQCCKPCHNQTYDNEEMVIKMIREQKNGIIPSSLVPKCPICGKEMTTNLRCDDTFVEDSGWKEASNRYLCFLKANNGKKILNLELGVGFNTPVIIKYPFWKMTLQNKNACYVCINKGQIYIPNEIKNRSLGFNADISNIINKLLEDKNGKNN